MAIKFSLNFLELLKWANSLSNSLTFLLLLIPEKSRVQKKPIFFLHCEIDLLEVPKIKLYKHFRFHHVLRFLSTFFRSIDVKIDLNFLILSLTLVRGKILTDREFGKTKASCCVQFERNFFCCFLFAFHFLFWIFVLIEK